MSVDLKANQLRVNKIINSGSNSSLPLLIYGLGSATNEEGGITSSHFTTGSDTWLFVSGAAGSKGTSTQGSVTFAGDMTISGTIYNAAGAAYVAGSSVAGANTQIQFNNNGSFAGNVNLTFATGTNVLSTINTSVTSLTATNVVPASTKIAFVGQGQPTPATFGTDGFLFFSGSNTARSVFGGPTIMSGSLTFKNVSHADTVSILTSGIISGSGNLQSAGNLEVAGGQIISQASSALIFSTNVTQLELVTSGTNITIAGSPGNSNLTFSLGESRSGDATLNLLTGPASSTKTKTINLGSGGGTGSSTLINIGTVSSSGTTTINVSGSMYMTGTILPGNDLEFTLGSPEKRWAHVYTGDLHLRNDRGDWTIIEEPDFLRIRNNKTGKNFKLLMSEID